MDNDHNYQYNEFNITFVVYFDEQLIQRIIYEATVQAFLMYRHVTMMHQQYTCITFYLLK